MDIWVFVLSVGATVRLTRLAAKDEIFSGPRMWLVNKLGPSEFWLKLFTCQPCASAWVGAAVASAAWWFGDSPWFLVSAFAFTLSAVASLVSLTVDP